MKSQKKTNDTIDAADLRTLLVGIIGQVIDDYVKLQNPTTRTKKYLQEHYLTAIDFLFDCEYELAHIPNGTNGNMNVKELLSEVLDSDYPDTNKLREYAIQQTKKYWEDRDLAVLDHIPDTVCISGHTFDVRHAYITGYVVNTGDHTITLDKENKESNQLNFLQAMLEAITMLEDVPVKRTLLRLLAKETYWVLKTNNMFSYVGVASEKDLFSKQE